MVRLVCILIDKMNHKFSPPRAANIMSDVQLSTTVKDLSDTIRPSLEKLHHYRLIGLTLHVAQQADGSWPDYSVVRHLRPDDIDPVKSLMEPHRLLSEYFGESFEPQNDDDVHVLAVRSPWIYAPIVPVRPPPEFSLMLQNAHRSGELPSCLGDADVDLWTRDDCGTTKDLTPWKSIVTSLPPTYFVRYESLMVWRVFRETFQYQVDRENGVDVSSAAYREEADKPKLNYFRRLMLEGTPGVGKTALVNLMSLWLAVKQKRNVLLLEDVGYRFDAIFLSGDTGRYYVWEGCKFGMRTVDDLSGRVIRCVHFLNRVDKWNRVWVCKGRMTNGEYNSLLDGVPFHLWSARGEIHCSGRRMDFLRLCLVPFWTLDDLKAIGALYGFDEDECTRRYEVSGGSLGQFLKDPVDAQRYIDKVLTEPEREGALRPTLPRWRKVVFMPTVKNTTRVDNYVRSDLQCERVTSEYARQRLGGSEQLWEMCGYPRKKETKTPST